MSFLPQDYQKPVTQSNYMKLQTGDNKIRILGSAIVGYIDWDNKKPVRTKTRPTEFFDNEKPPKHFWAFPVWDYATKSVKILEVTQTTIQGAIYELSHDENWGDPKEYDITIKKTGEKMETEYSVVPIPPKPLHAEIARLFAEAKINLDALWTGGDPFANANYTAPVGDNSEPTEEDISSIPF